MTKYIELEHGIVAALDFRGSTAENEAKVNRILAKCKCPENGIDPVCLCQRDIKMKVYFHSMEFFFNDGTTGIQTISAYQLKYIKQAIEEGIEEGFTDTAANYYT